MLCEKIGQTRAGHFPHSNYPHLAVLLQAAWTAKRGKKEEAKGKLKDVSKTEKTVHRLSGHSFDTELWKIKRAFGEDVFTLQQRAF